MAPLETETGTFAGAVQSLEWPTDKTKRCFVSSILVFAKVVPLKSDEVRTKNSRFDFMTDSDANAVRS